MSARRDMDARRALACDPAFIARHYRRPDWFTKHVFNPAIAGLTRLGISVAGSRVLEVPGRRSGEPRRTPVNLLVLRGERYLVAPRGNTQWARNLRASGAGRLLVGRRVEGFAAAELSDDEKPPILRAYLRRWKWEVGMFFDGVDADSPEDEVMRIAPRHPVFRIEPPHPAVGPSPGSTSEAATPFPVDSRTRR